MQFIKDINDEIADKPVANNPQSNISFMTEPPKFGGRITATAQNPDKVAVGTAPGGAALALPPPIALPPIPLAMPALPPLPTTDKIKPPNIVLPPVPETLKPKPDSK